MWKREDLRTRQQQNIPGIIQQPQNTVSSRRDLNESFPHKLFRHGRSHHRRTESESAAIDCKSKERKMKDFGKHEPLRVPIFEGGFKSNEEYVYVRGRGRGKYVCEECGIRCKKPSMLKKHIRTHTDMRPYKCSICNFAFKTKGNLTKHMKSKAHNKKTVSTGGDDDDSLNPDDDDDERIDDEEYENDHQFSDADENEDTDSAEGETSDEEDEDDYIIEGRCHDHSLFRIRRSHGSLPDISGFSRSSSEFPMSSILAEGLPSFHGTRSGTGACDSFEGVPARRTLKRSYSESLDKVRKDKCEDTLKPPAYLMAQQMAYLTNDAGKSGDRKPTRSEVVGKLTQHLTNKNLEKLRAQTQSHPLVSATGGHAGSGKSFDITQLPLPLTGPGMLPMPTFQRTYGMSAMNLLPSVSGSSRNEGSVHSAPIWTNYRVSSRIHEATNPDKDNSDNSTVDGASSRSEYTHKTASPEHVPETGKESVSTIPVEDKIPVCGSETVVKCLVNTEKPTASVPDRSDVVGSIFIPVSSVLRAGGLITPTTAPYSAGQFIFTFPIPNITTVSESEVPLPMPHPNIGVLTSPSQTVHNMNFIHSSGTLQSSVPVMHKDNTNQGPQSISAGTVVTKRKRSQEYDTSTAPSWAGKRTESVESIRINEIARRIRPKYTSTDTINQQLSTAKRLLLPKNSVLPLVQANQAQFIPPVMPPEAHASSPLLSPLFSTVSYGSKMSAIPLISPISPSRMSQLPATILSKLATSQDKPTHDISLISESCNTISKIDQTAIPPSLPSSLSTESIKSDTPHWTIVEMDSSEAEGIPSPTATRGGFHKCNVCRKDFTKPSQLRIHMRTHADEHPYSCEECSLSFRTRGLLQKHERSPVHFSHVEAVELSTENADDPRPFKCKECSIAFRIPGHLAKHLRSKGHLMALERQGKLSRHRQDLIGFDGSISKEDIGEHDDENTDSASEGEIEKVIVEEVMQVEYMHQPEQSD